MEIINPLGYKNLVEEAQKASFAGWDFSWLDGRLTQEDPPWDYVGSVKEHIKKAQSLLDLGTGGGEVLASLLPLPPETHATESYPPNQVIASERLNPLGIEVHNTRDEDPLPFSDDYFDLVINRHESYDPSQVHRVLKPGGVFITQQVGGLDNLELNQVLQKETSFPFIKWGLAAALTGLYEENFDVELAEKAVLLSTFLDIGAVLYYLKAIPWQVEGFDPATHKEGLVKIHNIIQQQGKFIATAHRFIIITKKKARMTWKRKTSPSPN